MNSTYSQQMLEALDNQELHEAQRFFEEALHHDDPETLSALGEHLLAHGFLEEAARLFEQLLNDFPEATGLHIPLAEIAIENNEIDQAFEHLELVDPSDEAYVESLVVTADLYQVLGIPEVSERKLQDALALTPDEPLLLYALAELHFSAGNFGQAAEEYANLLPVAEELESVNLHERLANSFSMVGAFEEAIPEYEEALKSERTDDLLFQTAFTYLQIEEQEKAISLLQELRLLNPQYQSMYYYLASALQEEERLEEAQEIALEGVKEAPYQVELYRLTAEISYRLHDVEQAEKFLLEALEKGEDADTTRLTLANLYLQEERYDEVLAQLNLIEDQDNPYVDWNFAETYAALEEFSLARTYYEKAAKELPHEVDFLRSYGLFLREEGDREQAHHVLSHYLQHVPDDVEIALLLEEGNEDTQDF